MENEKCKETKVISRLINGELDSRKRTEILDHLKSCPICQKEYRELLEVDKYLAFYQEEEPPVELDNKILSKIESNKHVNKRLPMIISVAASFVLAFILGIYISNSSLNTYNDNYANLGSDTFYSLIEGE